jgi:hypothetical protein
VKSMNTLERSFGLSVGGVLLLIAGVLVWRGRPGAAELVGAIGAVLVILALVRPSLLKWPRAGWMRLALALGYVNARVILTLAFVLVLTPMGLIWRLIGRDPLGRSRRRWLGWVPHHARYRSAEHYRRMY